MSDISEGRRPAAHLRAIYRFDLNGTALTDRSPGGFAGDSAEMALLRGRYARIKAETISPLREEMERSLDQLRDLMPIVWGSCEPGAQALAVEMEQRRVRLIRALNAGTEI